MRPSVDLPAPRRPIKAMRSFRAGSAAGCPSTWDSVRRARISVASSRPRSSSRTTDHSGDDSESSPTSSAIVAPSARASWREQHHRGVALARLEVGEMAFRDPCGDGKALARQAALRSQRPHPVTQVCEEGVFGHNESILVHVRHAGKIDSRNSVALTYQTVRRASIETSTVCGNIDAGQTLGRTPHGNAR